MKNLKNIRTLNKIRIFKTFANNKKYFEQNFICYLFKRFYLYECSSGTASE